MDELPDNVNKFLQKTSAEIGMLAQERFSQDLYCTIFDEPIASPIEQLFLIAVHAQCFAEYTDVNAGPESRTDGVDGPGRGIQIRSQWKVDKYRADFFMWQEGLAPADVYPPVIVELDGHDFHDRNKQQRSYEKARDRHFIKKGYRVVHYTGSDVVKDPNKVAFEVLEMLGLYGGTARGLDDGYDPADPYGTGGTD